MAGRVLKGISWSAIQQFSTQIIQFLVTVVLARILTPSEFGVVAASTIVLSILQVINEAGFGAALMQKLDRDETDFFTVFILNIIVGIVLYLFIILTSNVWATLFKTPELQTVIKWLGLNLVISSFMIVQRTKLWISVNFKTWTKASVSSAIISGIVGILLASSGFGVYALVAQSLVYNLLSVILIWFFVRWKPNWHFSFERIRNLFSFAYKLIAARLINIIFIEGYSSVIALIYNPTDLAFFNRAKSFENLSSSNLVSIVQRVSIPLMCEVQKSQQELRHITLKFIQSTSLIIFPIVIILITLAKPIIIILLTDKWIESANILRIIAVAALFYNISAFNMNVFNATGRTDLALKCELIKKVISVIIIIIAILFKNFYVLIWSYVLCAIIESIINVIYTKPLLNINFFDQLKTLLPLAFITILVSIFISIGIFFFQNIYIQLFVFGVLGLGVYICLCYIFDIYKTKKYISSFLYKFKI